MGCGSNDLFHPHLRQSSRRFKLTPRHKANQTESSRSISCSSMQFCSISWGDTPAAFSLLLISTLSCIELLVFTAAPPCTFSPSPPRRACRRTTAASAGCALRAKSTTGTPAREAAGRATTCPAAHRTGSVRHRKRARVLPYGVVNSAIRHGYGRRPEKYTLGSKSWHKNRVVPLNERRMEDKLNSGDSLTWCFPIGKYYQPKPAARFDSYSVGQLGFCAKIPLFACTFWDNSVSVPLRRVQPPSHLGL